VHETDILRKYATPPMYNYVQAKYKNTINCTCPCNVAVTTISINAPKRKNTIFFIKHNDWIATEYLFSKHNTILCETHLLKSF